MGDSIESCCKVKENEDGYKSRISCKQKIIGDFYFSRIFARKGRFEIGLKLFRLEGSEPFFFSIGVIIAVLREEGTEPDIREECTILAISGARDGNESLTRFVGSGSSLHDDDFKLVIMEDS